MLKTMMHRVVLVSIWVLLIVVSSSQGGDLGSLRGTFGTLTACIEQPQLIPANSRQWQPAVAMLLVQNCLQIRSISLTVLHTIQKGPGKTRSSWEKA